MPLTRTQGEAAFNHIVGNVFYQLLDGDLMNALVGVGADSVTEMAGLRESDIEGLTVTADDGTTSALKRSKCAMVVCFCAFVRYRTKQFRPSVMTGLALPEQNTMTFVSAKTLTARSTATPQSRSQAHVFLLPRQLVLAILLTTSNEKSNVMPLYSLLSRTRNSGILGSALPLPKVKIKTLLRY
jgi:hypothetical protein